MRDAVNELHQAGRIGYGVWGTGVFVEALLQRGAAEDLTEAEARIDWLANVSADNDSAVLEITLLPAACAAGPGPPATMLRCQDLVECAVARCAKSLGFEGHGRRGPRRC